MTTPTQPRPGDRAGPARRRYAFVGTGHRGQTYFTALLGRYADVGHPVALCDTNATRMAYYNELRRAADPRVEPLPAYGADDFGALLERERPDVVVVTTVDAVHHRYLTRALAHGCDVVTEKPLTTDAAGCRAVVDATRRSRNHVVLTFNYRYAARHGLVKELVASGVVGEVTSVHFEWVLDTVHGADYFRRWHRRKEDSGGLLVHKSTHHVDLVNWWLDDVPESVYAQAALRFYGRENARRRGVAPAHHRSHGAPDPAADPFALDLAASPHLRRLYLDAEHEDGYLRDRDVFSDGVTIEDNMAVLVRYQRGALLTYALNAHAPWEGYRVALNGTAGRLELDVCERASVRAGSTWTVVGGDPGPAVDPTASGPPGPGAGRSEDTDGDAPARRVGTRLTVQRHWEPAQRVEVPESDSGHAGADEALLDDVFRGTAADPLGRRAGYLDGVRSVLVGVAANRSVRTGEPVRLADFGLPLHEADL